jgi:hypothetical protein
MHEPQRGGTGLSNGPGRIAGEVSCLGSLVRRRWDSVLAMVFVRDGTGYIFFSPSRIGHQSHRDGGAVRPTTRYRWRGRLRHDEEPRTPQWLFSLWHGGSARSIAALEGCPGGHGGYAGRSCVLSDRESVGWGCEGYFDVYFWCPMIYHEEPTDNDEAKGFDRVVKV